MRPWILFGILLASLGCQLVGLVMFAKGFFPYKAMSTSFASLDDLPPLPSLAVSGPIRQEQVEQLKTGTVAPRFGKMVLMLIDALRRYFGALTLGATACTMVNHSGHVDVYRKSWIRPI